MGRVSQIPAITTPSPSVVFSPSIPFGLQLRHTYLTSTIALEFPVEWIFVVAAGGGKSGDATNQGSIDMLGGDAAQVWSGWMRAAEVTEVLIGAGGPSRVAPSGSGATLLGAAGGNTVVNGVIAFGGGVDRALTYPGYMPPGVGVSTGPAASAIYAPAGGSLTGSGGSTTTAAGIGRTGGAPSTAGGGNAFAGGGGAGLAGNGSSALATAVSTTYTATGGAGGLGGGGGGAAHVNGALAGSKTATSGPGGAGSVQVYY